MSKNKTALAATARAKAGKGAARAVRREGKIPGVIYGDKKEPLLVSVDKKELGLAIGKKGFFTQLCDLTVDGQKHLVLPREVQVDPVFDRPEHADFLRVSEKTIIRVGVPLRTINEKASPGIVKGGVLNLIRHEIEVYVKATEIPEEFVADLTGLDVGQTVHIGALKLSAGIKPVQQGDFSIITIVAPSALKSDEETTTAAATPGAEGAAAPADGAAAPAAGAAAPAKGAAAPAAAAKGAAPAAAPAKGGDKKK
ncbi:MAG: 50S ribosomal protein L25/general stress protein Ctc [Alphaproteobacteria bacterium]